MRVLRAVARGVLVLGLGAGASACRTVLATVLDLPPPRAAPPDRTATRPVEAGVLEDGDTVRPLIESLLSRDSVVALLPRDRAGNIDWVAALRGGVINPRRALPGRRAPIESGFAFAYDFAYRGSDTTFNAVFPHSAHTEWLQCQQCHPRIFPYRNTPVTMTDVFQGRYCGECHGRVAFPIVTACERCHQSLTMPAGRAQPDLIGTVTMRRVPADSAGGNAYGMNTDALPRAQFPHWVHRIRYRCAACHMEVFEPRAGANDVTMNAIGDGRACGRCHNGRAAFAAGVGNCQRCHVAPAGGPAGG